MACNLHFYNVDDSLPRDTDADALPKPVEKAQ